MATGNILYSCTFFREISSNGSFHISEDYIVPLYWLLHPELLFTRESVYCHCMDFLNQACSGKPIYKDFFFFFLPNTWFSVYITQSSVNFTWFALLNHQKFDDGPLFNASMKMKVLKRSKIWEASETVRNVAYRAVLS